ncbi:hypothetical protein FAM15346_001125 [Propionibacterium freudenreichii]|uniref:hypothetical protein n=1 Tax=Propionibacterium freudenreichii TaxID=1744 RepID=UPI0005434FE7|nr:hypothetical protein [Propionibacterium freudenreichii]MDK9644103.1 hypothetical protein [Propionibacterium freudenreichii]CEG86645.1 Exopolyphosphatase [Propionibacterium freudenreichii]CEI27147.1 Exopolyphosphatase [Propionibacterium freudenreichii]
MPTFYDPGADAGEASEALRGLAHATQVIQRPQDMYSVLGDVLSGVRSLRQVLDQLATAHASNRALAFDDYGDHASGSADALAAADELHQAATLIDQAEDRLNAGMSAAGRIAWHSDPAAEQVPVRRWISVVFLQDSEADEVLDMIDRDGPDAAMDHLKNWDYGEETTSAALEDGHVYDLPPEGMLDREVRDGDYQMTYSHSFGHVGLYRLHTIEPGDVLDDEPTRRPAIAHAEPLKAAYDGSWFEHPRAAGTKQSRGLGL